MGTIEKLRIKTNIIRKSQLKEFYYEYEQEFNEVTDDEIDVYKIIRKHGLFFVSSFISWLYKETNIDIIGWMIDNGCWTDDDWFSYSWLVAQNAPDYISKYKHKYNWKMYSTQILTCCPEYFDADLYNWEQYSHRVAETHPEFIREHPEKYNWKGASWAIAQNCPELIDEFPDLYNWEEYSKDVAIYAKQYVEKYKNKYNWKRDSWAVAKYCPEFIDEKLYNWEEQSEYVIEYVGNWFAKYRKYVVINNPAYLSKIFKNKKITARFNDYNILVVHYEEV